jgi:hypothetical protein
MNSHKPRGGEGAAGAQPRKERPTSKQRPDRFPSAEIPRGLIEHYCRATAVPMPDCEFGVGWIANKTGIEAQAITFRLGLCAAAEMLLAHGRFIRSNNPKAEPTDPVMVVWVVVVVDAEEILKAAGIDPGRWEETRSG